MASPSVRLPPFCQLTTDPQSGEPSFCQLSTDPQTGGQVMEAVADVVELTPILVSNPNPKSRIPFSLDPPKTDPTLTPVKNFRLDSKNNTPEP